MGVEANYYEKGRKLLDSFCWLFVQDFRGDLQDAKMVVRG